MVMPRQQAHTLGTASTVQFTVALHCYMLTLSSAFPIALALVTSSASTTALPLVLPPPIFLLILPPLDEDGGALASSSANFCIVACRLLARLISSLHCSWKGS